MTLPLVPMHSRERDHRQANAAGGIYHGTNDREFGFTDLKRPERWMERPDPNIQETPDYWQP